MSWCPAMGDARRVAQDRPEPADASPPSSVLTTAPRSPVVRRTGSFGTRTGRGPGGAVEAVTMRRSPLARPSFRGQAFERYCLAGSAAGRFVAFRGACRPGAVSWNHRDVGCRPPPASSPAIQDVPARRVRYFAEFVRGLGLHTFGLSGGHARPSGCAALRIDCDRLKGMF